MKAIIYAGIGLFSVASVYGVADYYSTQKKGTLDKLYKEEVVTEPNKKTEISETEKSMNTIENNSTIPNKTITIVKASKKIKKQKRTIKMADFSRGRITESLPIELLKPMEVAKELPAKKTEERIIEKKAFTEIYQPMIIKKDPERKISLEMFSRAPLRNPATTAKLKSRKD